MYVWDAGIVLHSKALPPFLAALAPAVALAGQDISLMRRVRALIVSSSNGGRGHSAAAGGATMRWAEGRCMCCLKLLMICSEEMGGRCSYCHAWP